MRRQGPNALRPPRIQVHRRRRARRAPPRRSQDQRRAPRRILRPRRPPRRARQSLQQARPRHRQLRQLARLRRGGPGEDPGPDRPGDAGGPREDAPGVRAGRRVAEATREQVQTSSGHR